MKNNQIFPHLASIRISLFGLMVVAVFLLIQPIAGYGQHNPMPDATFTIVSQLDHVSGDTIKYDGVFRVKATELGWGINENELTLFKIEDSIGTWNERKNKGIVTYNVKLGESTGTIKIIGEKSHLIIEIVIELEGGTIKNKLFASELKYE